MKIDAQDADQNVCPAPASIMFQFVPRSIVLVEFIQLP
jgi:hypothetical protein